MFLTANPADNTARDLVIDYELTEDDVYNDNYEVLDIEHELGESEPAF
ncbi:hypothetical protein H7X46_11480 [Pseudonocardia sp. C8]|nr:hypothetical protein [Pseudonocardia sp. C8]MBC3191682.1 hypothetical protein [Pseudonocardia sp. C8]